MAITVSNLTTQQKSVINEIIRIGIERGESIERINLTVNIANAESTFNPSAIGPSAGTTIRGTFQYSDDTWASSFSRALKNEPANQYLNGSASEMRNDLDAQITIMYSDLNKYKFEFDSKNYPNAYKPTANRPIEVIADGHDVFGDFSVYAYLRHNTSPTEVDKVINNVFDKYGNEYSTLVADNFSAQTASGLKPQNEISLSSIIEASVKNINEVLASASNLKPSLVDKVWDWVSQELFGSPTTSTSITSTTTGTTTILHGQSGNTTIDGAAKTVKLPSVTPTGNIGSAIGEIGMFTTYDMLTGNELALNVVYKENTWIVGTNVLIENIAAATGTTREQLQAANPGKDLTSLKDGDTVNLPTVQNGLIVNISENKDVLGQPLSSLDTQYDPNDTTGLFNTTPNENSIMNQLAQNAAGQQYVVAGPGGGIPPDVYENIRNAVSGHDITQATTYKLGDKVYVDFANGDRIVINKFGEVATATTSSLTGGATLTTAKDFEQNYHTFERQLDDKTIYSEYNKNNQLLARTISQYTTDGNHIDKTDGQGNLLERLTPTSQGAC